jgi:hypothetical protein
VFSLGKTVGNMLESIETTRKKGKVNSLGLTNDYIKDLGKMGSSMAKALISLNMENHVTVNGRRVNVFVG